MRKLLLTTTAAAVVLSAPGLALAQTSKTDKSGTQTQQMAPSTQPQNQSGAATGGTTQSQSSQTQPSADSGRTTTGQSSVGTGTAGANTGSSTSAQQTNPPAATSGTTNSPSTNAPSQAQSNTTAQPPVNQAQQSPNGTNTNSTAQQQPSTNANTAQQPTGNTTTNSAQQQQPAGNATTSTTQGSSTNLNASVNINEQQRTRLSQTFARLDVRPLNSVNFQVSVGTVVPRDIRLQPLPADVVEIVPQFRGYSFVAVRDEIVIVEPSSLKIVAVLPRSGGSHAATSTERKSTFSEQDRAVMRKHVQVRPRAQAPATTGSSTRTKVTIGERVPESVEIRSFPEEVYRESPRLKEYRYIEEGDRAYVVEPRERRIIEEIE